MIITKPENYKIKTKYTKPGIYDMPEHVYHSDPCETPSASRSFLMEIINKTPRHAAFMHPRINANYVHEDDKKFDVGKAAHDLILCGGDKLVELEFDDYRKNAAKDARDAAIAEGKTPLLSKDYEKVILMADSIKQQIKESSVYNDGFTNGKPERTILYQEGDVWVRVRPDWLSYDGWIDDLKTTAICDPQRWMETVMIDCGYDLQAFMDMRGYEKILGKKPKGVRFFCHEVSEPHCMFVVELDQVMLEQAAEKYKYAMSVYHDCLKSGEWPAYEDKIFKAFPSFKSDKLLMKIGGENE